MKWLNALFGRRAPDAARERLGLVQASAAEDDRRILRQLAALGADLAQPRHQRHYFSFSTGGHAASARERLLAAGFAVDVRDTGEHGWIAMAEQTAVVNLENVDELRERLTLLGAECGGVYTGWEAAPKP